MDRRRAAYVGRLRSIVLAVGGGVLPVKRNYPTSGVGARWEAGNAGISVEHGGDKYAILRKFYPRISGDTRPKFEAIVNFHDDKHRHPRSMLLLLLPLPIGVIEQK